jgi:hypothetical protein
MEPELALSNQDKAAIIKKWIDHSRQEAGSRLLAVATYALLPVVC